LWIAVKVAQSRFKNNSYKSGFLVSFAKIGAIMEVRLKATAAAAESHRLAMTPAAHIRA
jgi:hypothetical protein